MEIERGAKALVQLDRQLGQLAAKGRTLGTLLDQATARMSTDLQLHEQALRAQIELSQGQTTTELRNARQRLRMALLWAVFTPTVVTAVTCALIGAATWAWAQLQISNVQAAQAQLQQPEARQSQSPAASARRRP
ncbi:hypothetical protein AB4142_05905 [Variovorax sp. 2RAF20]|uniref:hypothetical protein n=1 Tax=Variovorax sp. CF313 TaxID=1144315 RepID=UPI0005B251B8|nr:hypothetical protein [Variovorax sp. CF313]